PLRRRHSMEHRVPRDPRIVDENVDRTELGLDLPDTADAGVIVGYGPFVDGETGIFAEYPRCIVIAAVIGRYPIPCLLRCARNRCADTPRPAGDVCRSCHGRSSLTNE